MHTGVTETRAATPELSVSSSRVSTDRAPSARVNDMEEHPVRRARHRRRDFGLPGSVRSVITRLWIDGDRDRSVVVASELGDNRSSACHGCAYQPLDELGGRIPVAECSPRNRLPNDCVRCTKLPERTDWRAARPAVHRSLPHRAGRTRPRCQARDGLDGSGSGQIAALSASSRPRSVSSLRCHIECECSRSALCCRHGRSALEPHLPTRGRVGRVDAGGVEALEQVRCRVEVEGDLQPGSVEDPHCADRVDRYAVERLLGKRGYV